MVFTFLSAYVRRQSGIVSAFESKVNNLLTEPTPPSCLLRPQRQPEDGAWKCILHIAAKHLKCAALIRVVAQQVCLCKVCPHAGIDGRDWQVGAVGVKIYNGRPRHKGGDIRQVVAGIEANPAVSEKTSESMPIY